MEEKLTGKVRLRTDKKGRLILQVEREYFETTNVGGHIDVEDRKNWRDARSEDLVFTTKEAMIWLKDHYVRA